jgi:hypothetical protein
MFSTAPNFSLRFKVKFSSIETNLAGLILFSASNHEMGAFGDQVPSIFSCPGATSLRIVQDNTQIPNFSCSSCTRNLQPNVWYLIEIYAMGNLFQNYINGQIEQSCTTTGERPSRNVTVYASSPFINATKAVISDLLYEDLSGFFLAGQLLFLVMPDIASQKSFARTKTCST